MKTKPASKAAVDEDEEKPKKTRSSRSKSRRGRRSRSLSDSESPPRKRSRKSGKRADKKSKKSKASRRRHRSPSPSRSLSTSSSPCSAHRHGGCSTGSSGSSASERSVSPPPRSQFRDVRKRKGRDRERGRKRRKAWRSTSCSSSSAASSDSSRRGSRSKNRLKRRAGSTKDGTARDKIQKDYGSRHSSRSEKNMTKDVDRVEEDLATAKMGNSKIDRYEKNVSLEKVESPPPKDAHETKDILPAGSGSPVAEDLELILRQKALENFRKFRAAAAMAGKTDDGATVKEALSDSPQSAGTKIAEARPAAVTPFQRQGITPGVRHSAGSRSSRSEDCENGTSHSWKQESSAGMNLGAGSPGIFEPGDTGGPTQQKGNTVEATRSTSQLISPQYSRNTGSVMQRLSSIPWSSSSVKQRLGSSAGASHVNGAPRVRSVVSIPAREGFDGSTSTTPPVPCENSAPVESSSQVGHPLIDINKADGTNGDDRKTSEDSASNGSVLSPAEGKNQATEARIEDKDSSEFQKKTFSRMHDGETVEVSYKVYIPKKTPALARRKLQR